MKKILFVDDEENVLLGIWGMPDAIVEAAQLHHVPSRMPTAGSFDALASIHIADGLLRAETVEKLRNYLDLEFVKSLGVEDQLMDWRRMVDQVREGTSEQAA